MVVMSGPDQELLLLGELTISRLVVGTKRAGSGLFARLVDSGDPVERCSLKSYPTHRRERSLCLSSIVTSETVSLFVRGFPPFWAV